MYSKRMFDKFDLESVRTLTTLVNQAKSEDETFEWFSGDNAVAICFLASIALEFDHLLPLDSAIRAKVLQNMVDNKMLVNSELGSPYKD